MSSESDIAREIKRLWREVERLKTFEIPFPEPVVPPVPPATPRIGMWLQDGDYNTVAKVNAILAWAEGRVSDLYPFVQDYDTNPKCVNGASTLFNVTATTVGGVPPFVYLCQRASAVGIKVHATFAIYIWSFWLVTTGGLVTGLAENGTNHDTSNGGSTINFSTAAVRSTINSALADFITENPLCSGLCLDYIRTDGTVTGQTTANVTSFVSECRAALPAGTELSVCALAVPNAESSNHQDIVAWLAAGADYIDTVLAMAYYTNLADKMLIFDACDWNRGHTLMLGVATEESSSEPSFNATRPSDTRASIRQFFINGYKNLALFSWPDSYDTAAQQAVIDEYLAGNIETSAPYPAVSSIVVTPGTGISFTIAGVTYSITEAEVSGYSTPGTIKAYIENKIGLQLPFMHFMRDEVYTTTLIVLLGDWEV